MTKIFQNRLLAGLLLFLCGLAFSPLGAAEKVSDPLAKMTNKPGYLPLFYQHESGKALLAVTRLDEPLIYQTALVTGVGSNDIGLDRGQLGQTRVIRFSRAGPKVLLIEENLRYRAESDNAQEVAAVKQAFAESVLAGLDVVGEYQGAPLVDLTPLLMQDSHGIGARLAAAEQGVYSLDAASSAVFPQNLLNFPHNTIIQVMLTYQGKEAGEWVSSVTPTAERMSVTYMHQFLPLPEPGYEPLEYHPRSGFFAIEFRDYAAPLGQSMDRLLTVRHRLQWKNGDASSGQVEEPLVYYLDPGTPEPMRSALIEGASWWADAFTDAGFADAFRVDILPEDAHPLDIRYNVIQWVHRSTRGWSYGSSVIDPRTGEIIKGHVTLGSSRVRQDMMIAEALTAPYQSPADRATAARDMALARLRQLAAHEVGHTLGLSHNFAASSFGDASVMDYPHPNLYLDEHGKVRLDRAYSVGVSAWDRWTIRYGYGLFKQPEMAREEMLVAADEQGFRFISDPDARVPGSPYPAAHLWDNGEDPVLRLNELMQIRARGLAGFSPAVIPFGAPLHELELRLAPVYLLHRYQIEAVSKLLGGVLYDHRLRGDSGATMEPVDAQRQEQALKALLDTLAVENLALPKTLFGHIPPPAEGYARHREYFTHATAPTFDHLAPARAAIELSLGELLHPARAARMNDQHRINQKLPDFSWVLRHLQDHLLQRIKADYASAIMDEMRWQAFQSLLQLVQQPGVTVRVRAQVFAMLGGWSKAMGRQSKEDSGQVSHYLREHIKRFLADPSAYKKEGVAQPTPVPPGSPIGMDNR